MALCTASAPIARAMVFASKTTSYRKLRVYHDKFRNPIGLLAGTIGKLLTSPRKHLVSIIAQQRAFTKPCSK